MATAKQFVIEALTYKLKTFYPDMPENKLRKLVEIVETNMRSGKSTDPKYLTTLAEMGIGTPEELQRLTSCQIDVSAALVGLGGDIADGEATVKDIIWNC